MGHTSRRWYARATFVAVGVGAVIAAAALIMSILVVVQNNDKSSGAGSGGGGGGPSSPSSQDTPSQPSVQLLPGTHPVCAPVTIAVDSERGQPRITATNDIDGHVGIGYAMASTRLFQMDFFRHLGGYRLAELVGPDALPLDVNSYFIDPYPDKSERFAALPLAVREEYNAWAAGVNAWLAEPWTTLPAEYVVLGFPDKSQVAPFEGADALRLLRALEFDYLEVAEITTFSRLSELLARQPIANLSAACVPGGDALPFSLPPTSDCINLVRFVLIDLMGSGAGATAPFRAPLATEYLTFYNTTPPFSSAGAAFTATAGATPVPAGGHAAVIQAAQTMVSKVRETERLRLKYARPHTGAAGTNCIAFNGPRAPANGKSLLGNSPDLGVRLPNLSAQVRLVVTGTSASSACAAGGAGTRHTPADAIIQLSLGVPLLMQNPKLSMASPARYADLLDVFAEVLFDDGAGSVVALSGRDGDSPRAVVVDQHLFYASTGAGSIVPAFLGELPRIPENNNAVAFASYPTEVEGLTMALTIQTALPRYWTYPPMEQLMRCGSVAALHALMASADMGTPVDLVASDYQGNTGHMTLGPRVPLREDFELLRAPDLVGPSLIRDGFSAVPHRWIRAAVPGADGFMFERLPRTESLSIINPADGVLTAANQDATGIDTFDPVLGTRRFRWTTGGMVYLSDQLTTGQSVRAFEVRRELARIPPPTRVGRPALAALQASTESPLIRLVRDQVLEAYDWAAANPSSVAATTYLATPVLASAAQVLRGWAGTCATAAVNSYDVGDSPDAPAPSSRTAAARAQSAGCTVATVTFDALSRQHGTFLCAAAFGIDPLDQVSRYAVCPMTEQAVAWLALYNTSATPGVLSSGLDLLATSDPPAATRAERKRLWVLRAFDTAVRALRDPARFPVFGGATDATTYTWGKLNRYYAPHLFATGLTAPLTFAAGDGQPGYPLPGTYGSPWPAFINLDSESMQPHQGIYQEPAATRRLAPGLRTLSEKGPVWEASKLETVQQLGVSGTIYWPTLAPDPHLDDQFTHWVTNSYYRDD